MSKTTRGPSRERRIHDQEAGASLATMGENWRELARIGTELARIGNIVACIETLLYANMAPGNCIFRDAIRGQVGGGLTERACR